MTDDGAGYIYVRNWQRHQHYRTRRPIWIKVYLELMHDETYLALSMAQRGLLADLWKLTAELGNGHVPASRQRLARMLAVTNQGDASHLAANIEALNHAGWIELRDSTMLEPEVEVEAEVDSKIVLGSPVEGAAVDKSVETVGNHVELETLPMALAMVRTDAIGKVLRQLGSDADGKTERVIERLVTRCQVSQFELEQAREAIPRTPAGTSRAAYFVGTLKRVIGERGHHHHQPRGAHP